MICQFTGNNCEYMACPLWHRIRETCLVRLALMKYIGWDVEEKKIVHLCEREREVLGHITDGCSNKEIANITGISCQTVKNHITNIMRKMGAKNRTDLAVINIRLRESSGKETI